MKKSFPIFSMLFCLGAGSCWAQLTWQSKLLEFHPAVTDSNIVARFAFQNTGKTPISILAVKSTCDCTIPELQKRRYEPGEKAEIVVVYPTEEHVGTQERTIHVRTDDPRELAVHLTLRVQVPELFKTTPRVVHWTVGESPAPKTMSIQIVHMAGAHVTSVDSSDPKMQAQVESSDPDGNCVLKVTPTDTAQPSMVTLKIKIELPERKMRTGYAYALVK